MGDLQEKWNIPKVVRDAIGKPYAPEITNDLVARFRYIRYLLDKEKRSPGLVNISAENIEGFMALYNFERETVKGSYIVGLHVWQFPSLPDDTYFVRKIVNGPGYGPREDPVETYYLVHMPNIEMEREQQAREHTKALFGSITNDGISHSPEVGTQRVRRMPGGEIAPIVVLTGELREKAEAIADHFTVTVESAVRMAIKNFHRVVVLGEEQIGDHGE